MSGIWEAIIKFFWNILGWCGWHIPTGVSTYQEYARAWWYYHFIPGVFIVIALVAVIAILYLAFSWAEEIEQWRKRRKRVKEINKEERL